MSNTVAVTAMPMAMAIMAAITICKAEPGVVRVLSKRFPNGCFVVSAFSEPGPWLSSEESTGRTSLGGVLPSSISFESDILWSTAGISSKCQRGIMSKGAQTEQK